MGPAADVRPAGPGAPAVLSGLLGRWSRSVGWERAAPIGLALLAAVLYGWNLTVSGYANTYYAAAAQAGAQSWSAWFFGSFDAANFITIDKPPAALWLIGLSVRLFGLSSWSILLPQAVAGVASVLVLQATVRRSFGSLAGLIAGVAFALTPVAALIFRYDNPDAVLTLLLLGAAWAFVRGLEDGRLRWPMLAATLVGFAFLTKYLQAYLVVPAFAFTYLIAAPTSLRRRLVALVASALALAVASGWWVAIVQLIPAASRPFIGGSTNNSVLDLVFGYDGLGRIFGGGGGAGALPGGAAGGPPGGGFAFGGASGPLRMFNEQFGGQVSWLLPLAALGLAVGLVARRRVDRTDARRAGYLLWGLWAATTGAVFSLMSGIIHPYYTVALAPALAALAGAGIAELWALRSHSRWAGVVLAFGLVATAWWGWQLLERTPDFWPGVGAGAFFITLAAALLVAFPADAADRRTVRIGRLAAAIAIVAMLVGPTLYTLETAGRALSGGDPQAGPATALDSVGPPSGGGRDAETIDQALVDYLVANRGEATWLVAATSANQAGVIQIAAGAPVMAMGGFLGTDPTPTLAQLQAYVDSGEVRYVLVGGAGGGPGGFFGGDGIGDTASARTAWVTSSCTPVHVAATTDAAGGGTLYDCAAAP
ncbi:MAG: glycosyltransferase family 39 protein [Candidatus Limnocylindrales bacterium]